MMVRVLEGDCREVLKALPSDSVHCCVTSPPYWGLRDYGVSGQIGLESTFTDFISEMVGVFREVRRVLRPDGTLWLNLGDSYATHRNDHDWLKSGAQAKRGWHGDHLKPKDLCGVPWRVALALQEDGWWLRQDIIWAKPNPMPESVTDRCTKSHEYLFLLSKSPRYYFDAEAIKEDVSGGAHPAGPNAARQKVAPAGSGIKTNDSFGPAIQNATRADMPTSRNKRSVWEIATSPFPQAHFATFPPALVEPCIKAGTSEKGCCGKCGAPWGREVEKGDLVPTREQYDKRAYGVVVDNPDPQDQGRNRARDGHRANMAYEKKTLGWKPSCLCCVNDICRSPVACKGFGHCRQPYIEGEWPAPVPCTVLDPFGGAGTTGLVADRQQRNAIIIELNPQYAEMARRRIEADAPLLTQALAAE